MRFRNQTGASKLTLLVFGLIVGAALYSAYHILPFYYYFYELKSHMQSVIRVASTESDAEIRRRLLYHIKKYELPVEPEDLKVIRNDRHMQISLDWQEVFYVTFRGKDYDIYVFNFHAFEEGDF